MSVNSRGSSVKDDSLTKCKHHVFALPSCHDEIGEAGGEAKRPDGSRDTIDTLHEPTRTLRRQYTQFSVVYVY